MEILVLGGNRFVGRHIVQEAVERGHGVTLFNRGNHPAPAGVTKVISGDRDSDLHRLGDRKWDAVIDTSAYFPRQVRSAASVLKDRATHYCLISTISVYADPTMEGLDESSPVAQVESDDVTEVTKENYGGLKVACEAELASAWPARDSLVIRPGIVIGPHDPTDRFTYWPIRAAAGRTVLAPGDGTAPVQFIDARDLAAWVIESVERNLHGTYNAITAPGAHDFASMLAACGATDIIWAAEDFLLERDVTPFADLPLWLPGTLGNMFRVSNAAATREGLTTRPLEQSAQDTLKWFREQDRTLSTGLTTEREAEILGEWQVRPSEAEPG